MTRPITRVSFNINGANFPNRPYFMDFLKRLQPTTLLVMDSYDLAISLAASLPNTKIVHRSYAHNEDRQWLDETPESYVARETAWGHFEIWRNVLNEPPIGDPLLMAWLVDVAQRFAEKGYKAVLGNFAVGSYEQRHVESGYFDPLLMSVYTANMYMTNMYIGVHEYTSILLPFGVGQWSFEQLYTKSDCQPEFWPTELPVKRVGANLPGYWHIRRSDWLTLRAREQGWLAPQFWITESGWDALPDMGNAGALDHFKNTYGIPAPHTSLRGVNTLRNVWRDYFPQWSFERAAFEQLKWLNSIYPENYVGFNLFTVNGNDDWKKDAGCDYSELYELHDLLLAEKQAPPAPTPIPAPVEIPFPTSGFEPVTLIPTDGAFNVRRQPAIAADKTFRIDDKVRGEIAADKAVSDGSMLWYPIRSNLGEGWAREDVFTFVFDVPPTPPRVFEFTEAEWAVVQTAVDILLKKD